VGEKVFKEKGTVPFGLFNGFGLVKLVNCGVSLVGDGGIVPVPSRGVWPLWVEFFQVLF
jgi:hypothetical protein